VQEDPTLIQPLIQQIAAANPQLAQLITQNPEALLQLLGAGGDDDDMGEYGDMGGEVMQVNLTPEEAAAVERVSLPPQVAICAM
jgi:UV excision repair protein RAD23